MRCLQKDLGGLMAVIVLTGFSPAQARETGQIAILHAPAPKARLIAHGLLWHCEGTRCIAAPGDSRPLVLCEALARVTGPISSFATSGEGLNPNQIDRCNRAADGAEKAAR
jgi:hypothetical protein